MITGHGSNVFNGIAMHNAGSNGLVVVATAGMFIVGCEGTVVSGQPVIAGTANGVLPYSINAGSILPIGRAITGAGSEGYAVVQLGN